MAKKAVQQKPHAKPPTYLGHDHWENPTLPPLSPDRALGVAMS
jgi:hypothetical protein